MQIQENKLRVKLSYFQISNVLLCNFNKNELSKCCHVVDYTRVNVYSDIIQGYFRPTTFANSFALY